METMKLLAQWIKTDEQGRSSLYTKYIDGKGHEAIRCEPITSEEAAKFAAEFGRF